jgi:Sel1 repeat
MAAEAGSATNQGLTLDHSSFEKLLAAAWVLQCLQDQLHPEIDHNQTAVPPLKIPTQTEPASSSFQLTMKPVLEASLTVIEPDGKHSAPSDQPTKDEPPVELVAAPPPLEAATLNFGSAVKIEPKTVELNLPSENMATACADKGPVLGLAGSSTDRGELWATPRAASLLQVAHVRSTLSRALDSLANRVHAFRVKLTLRALRAVAIATPVWLLSLVAALLFLEVWRQGSFQSAQATLKPTPRTVQAAVSDLPTTLTSTTLTSKASAPATNPVSQGFKRTNTQTRQPRTIPPLEVSHKHITDPATSAAVQQLSRYEIKGLRRQAKYGDESAAFILGMAYEVGRFVPQNCAEAARWVSTAAEAGDAAAQYNLGLRYRDGDGVAANQALSNQWLRKAAALRNRQAKQALKMLASR